VKTAEKEFKNLLGEFTRKSQDLAAIKRGGTPGESPKPDLNNPAKKPWEDPNWQPASYQEILDASVEKLKADLDRDRTAKEEETRLFASTVDTQVSEIRKTDPNLNEVELYKHAAKYGFGLNIKGAYQNMKDLQITAKKAADMTAQNLAKRAAEPIHGGARAGAVVTDGDVYDPNARNTSLSDALKAFKP
jgi:hypothetical protein